MKFGIRAKIILSFFLVVLIMSSGTIAFIRVFSAAYMNGETNRILKKEATEFADIFSDVSFYGENSLTVLKARFEAKMYYFNYSMFILDSEGHILAGYNTDGINVPIEVLNSLFEEKIKNTGASNLTIAQNEYSIYIKPVISYTGQVIGYVAPFYSAKAIFSDEILISFCIITICTAAVLSAFLGCFLSWPLTTNIYKLKKRTKLIAEKKYDDYIPIKSNDELKELSNSIEEMVSAIKERDTEQRIFLQNASHELRTPLMSIRGYIEGINDTVFSYEETSPAILKEINRLEKIVEQILYLSKIETANVLNFEEVRLSDILTEVESRVRGLLLESSKTLKINNYDDLIMTIDGDNFSIAITNIISNCARFAKNEITVDCIKKDDFLNITVYDDGNGIMPEELPHIFERFYRGKNGKHGLGLSISRAIIQSHGGNLTAYNRTDNEGNITGAAFEIKIPIQKKHKKENRLNE